MATIKPNWTTGVVLRAPATLAASTTATHDIDLSTLGADRSDIQIDINVGSASSVTVEIFGSSDAGATVDDAPLTSYQVSTNDIRSIPVTGPWRRVSLTNNDGSSATGNIGIKHAWRNFDAT